MEDDRPAVYRPRKPRASPLWQCVNRHLPELRAAGRVRRAVEENVLERYLECGDLHRGFARIRCGGCGHDLLLAFSCKTRYFCPSCHQKRVLAYGDWVESSVLRPVPHRQYVFTVPKLVRPFFAFRRSLLGEFCRLIARALTGGVRRRQSLRPSRLHPVRPELRRPGQFQSPRTRARRRRRLRCIGAFRYSAARTGGAFSRAAAPRGAASPCQKGGDSPAACRADARLAP